MTSDQIKIGDFGLATVAKNKCIKNTTPKESNIGTPLYTAPE